MTQKEEIQREAELCREACKNVKVGDLMSHIHHGQWLEYLSEPIENRITFILENKSSREQAERLRRMRPFDWQKADADWQKAYADWQKAYADRQKAYADRQKAYADWQKAYADRQKADADRQKAAADLQKAYADWQKAYADRQKADADRQKAAADLQKADADRQKAAAAPAMLKVHAEVCGCPWGPETDIFGNPR